MLSTKPKVLTINVGNLSLGGTGKTPHIEYLVRLLSERYKVSILSRGYKRKTKNFVLANENATADTIGDEPMQYYLKFQNKINVVVSENRVEGVSKIQSLFIDNQIVLLDDAFQHRRITPYLNILLSDYSKSFFDDDLVPFGRLRDIRQSAKRADAVIITKCPNRLAKDEKEAIRSRVLAYTKSDIPVFFSKISYRAITGYAAQNFFDSTRRIRIATAIAKPDIFVKYLSEQCSTIEKVFDFPDHHTFSRKDIDEILKNDKNILQIITTEKDMVKLKPQLSENELKYFFYLPIEIEIENKFEFDAFINAQIHSFYQ